ncbi:hypothetical protein AB0L35_09345 [Streptomyces sp. NPDC052309]|uniref:hypothetical protein n=1 Tax=Streptomyces sp. NPDC052309 TaxID=3155421 RepID=UPI00344338E6
MRPAPRTAPTRGHRLAVTLTALLAVLLTLVPASSAEARVAPAGAAPVRAATTVPHPESGHHADDTCATVCAAQARARHDHLGERPAPPDHLTTSPPGTDAAPAARGRTPAASGPAAPSPGRTSHDRGRAPPAPSGT